jgi:uncharacterized membrane protein YdbT with pleckstrin-like domain
MTYVDENLITGEEVRYRAQLHWMALIRYYVGGILLVGGGVALVFFGLANDALPATIGGGVLCVAGLGCAVMAKLHRDSAEFAITNKRVILKTGIIQRRTSEMFLAKVETVGVDQGLLARALDYGTISLRGTGGTAEPFSDIARPLEFRRQVQEQMATILGH